MTPDHVRRAIATHQHMAQQDPEVWHSVVDSLRKQVLTDIAAGATQAPELAAAVLEADDIPVLWHTCA